MALNLVKNSEKMSISEYDLEKETVTSDFSIPKLNKVRKIVIAKTEKGHLLQLKQKQNDSNVIYEIPLENVKDVDISYEWIGRKEKRKDLLIQLIFVVNQRYDQQRLRTLRLNVKDEDIGKVIRQMNGLKGKNTFDNDDD